MTADIEVHVVYRVRGLQVSGQTHAEKLAEKMRRQIATSTPAADRVSVVAAVTEIDIR